MLFRSHGDLNHFLDCTVYTIFCADYMNYFKEDIFKRDKTELQQIIFEQNKLKKINDDKLQMINNLKELKVSTDYNQFNKDSGYISKDGIF